MAPRCEVSVWSYTAEVRLYECIPNLSEGRDMGSLESLATRLRALDVAVLDLSVDSDHHRSVLTLAAGEEALRRGVFALYEHALKEWSLSRHRGVHPRMGLVDVLPIVPLGSTSMADAVALARSLGAQIARRFSLPVYLYENAARHRERKNLADLRRGGLRGVRGRIATPAWRPDFGPAFLHPEAGASAVGARFFLVAFNVVLDSTSLSLARSIAARLRASGGGLPAVKALGFWLERRQRVQVSMNLVDFRRSSPHAAFRAVTKLAGEAGVEVLGSEFVGLVPAAALLGGPVEELRLEGFSDEKILEERLRAHGL